MENATNYNFIGLLSNNRKIIAVIVSFCLLVSLTFTLFQPFLYSSSVSLLIIQKDEATVDAYSALRSSERIGDSLAQIVYTTSFYDKVVNSGYQIDESIFSKKESKKREQWKKMIATSVNRGTGILEITVYHESKDQALLLSKAIAYILTVQGWEYVGGGEIQVKMVDSPLVSNWPVKPNILLNIFSALALGFVASVAYIALTEKNLKQKNNRVFYPKKESAISQNNIEKPEVKGDNFEKSKTFSLNYPAEIVTMYDHLK